MTKQTALNIMKERIKPFIESVDSTMIDSTNFTASNLQIAEALSEGYDLIMGIDVPTWHPYPKEKPKEEGKYLCTWDLSDSFLSIFNYRTHKGGLYEDEWKGKGFYSYDREYGDCKRDNVVAWMELPEPYKENN